MKSIFVCLLFLASPILGAPPTLKLPKEVAGDPGTFIAVRAESSTAWVNYRPAPGLAVFPADLLSDRKATVVTARLPGRYKLFAYTGNEDGGADAEIVVVVGDAPVVVIPPVDPTLPPVTPTIPPVVPTVKATAATYVYEKDDTAHLPAVMSGLNKLNRGERFGGKTGDKILATAMEDDVTNGRNEVPSQYKVALAAARAAGEPALVVTAGDVVLAVVKAPKTEDDVLKAVP